MGDVRADRADRAATRRAQGRQYGGCLRGDLGGVPAGDAIDRFTAFVEGNPILRDVAEHTFSNRSVENSVGKVSGSLTSSTGGVVPVAYQLVKETRHLEDPEHRPDGGLTPKKWPRGPDKVRLRRMLDGALPAPVWPAGFSLRIFEPADAPDVHALLTRVFDDGDDGPFEEWWRGCPRRCRVRPSNCSSWSHDASGRLAAVAHVLDQRLPARPGGRARGAPAWPCRSADVACLCRLPGARCGACRPQDQHASTMPTQLRLYRRLGMVEVDWDG